MIDSGRTPKAQRDISDHSSLKPQRFLRKLVYASLPLGKGIVLDPFMGSGSTVAAAEAVGYRAIGVERLIRYVHESKDVIPELARLAVENWQLELI